MLVWRHLNPPPSVKELSNHGRGTCQKSEKNDRSPVISGDFLRTNAGTTLEWGSTTSTTGTVANSELRTVVAKINLVDSNGNQSVDGRKKSRPATQHVASIETVGFGSKKRTSEYSPRRIKIATGNRNHTIEATRLEWNSQTARSRHSVQTTFYQWR